MILIHSVNNTSENERRFEKCGMLKKFSTISLEHVTASDWLNKKCQTFFEPMFGKMLLNGGVLKLCLFKKHLFSLLAF